MEKKFHIVQYKSGKIAGILDKGQPTPKQDGILIKKFYGSITAKVDPVALEWWWTGHQKQTSLRRFGSEAVRLLNSHSRSNTYSVLDFDWFNAGVPNSVNNELKKLGLNESQVESIDFLT